MQNMELNFTYSECRHRMRQMVELVYSWTKNCGHCV